ncbi:MAG TPA: hypothetical protein VFZ21_10120 [Gemmatimonadaceae bacterium]|nr:hypothetical protein [Gemmatimonadaceae bacterium]
MKPRPAALLVAHADARVSTRGLVGDADRADRQRHQRDRDQPRYH